MKMISITTTGGGSSKQSFPLSQKTDTIIAIDGTAIARVTVSASGRVSKVDAEINGGGRTLYSEADERASMAPSVPLTDRQRDALEAALSKMDVGHLVTNYTSINGFELEHGPLPDEFKRLWRALAKATVDFQRELNHLGVEP